MSYREILQSFYDVVWVQGDVSAIDSYFAPQTEAQGLLPNMALDPADFEILVQTVMALVRDPKIEILRTIEDGDWGSALVHVTCQTRMTGQTVHLNGQVMARITDGKIAEVYNNFDMTSFFQDLGILPTDMIERALAGEIAA